MGSLIVNISFNNMFTDKVNMLYLYYRLRMFAKSRGGYITGFPFSHNEKYKLIPQLNKLGFVEKDKVTSYRELCNKHKAVNIYTKIYESDLTTLDDFKGFLISSTESYVLKRNYKIQEGKAKRIDGYEFVKRDWVNAGGDNKSKHWFKVKKIELDGSDALMGRVFTSIIKDMMNISTRSISRWRQNSSNQYKIRRYSPENVVCGGRGPEMYFRTKSKMVTIDQYIISSREVFSSKSYSLQHIL